eukprot:405352-Lingulodinium_polyedra.AAC.1
MRGESQLQGERPCCKCISAAQAGEASATGACPDIDQESCQHAWWIPTAGGGAPACTADSQPWIR